MKKFLFAVLMLASVLCLVFGAAACGETGGETAGNGSQTEQSGEDFGNQGGEQKPDEGGQSGEQKPDEGGQSGEQKPDEGGQSGEQKPDEGGQGGNQGSQGGTTPDDPNPSQHTHSFSSSWSSDDEEHWHATICGHSERQDVAAHTYRNGVCTTCNHEHVNHVYGDWVDDIPASETAMGSRHKECACGKRVTEQTPMITAFEYTQSGNGYAVTAYTGSLTELVVPAEHEGKPVTAIASRAFYDGEYTSIKLPTSLKEIGESAFGYCTKLQNIEIPNCARIGNSAFIGCDALQEITLPADTIFLGSSLFQYCSALKKVTMNGGTVQSTTFANAETLTEIVLGEGIKSVAQGSFVDCKKLQKLTMPRVETGESFMRYYFNVTPQIYTLSRTEDGPEISDLYPDEVVSHQYGNHVFALPKDYTAWYYDGKTIAVGGTVYTYDEKPVRVSSWKQFYDVTANAYWYGPKSWSATFYHYPETSLEKLTITNQMVSVYDKTFEECAFDIDVWEKFPITNISVKGVTEYYIDEFSQENYKLRVEYSDGFKEDFPLFDHISAADQAALRTVGEHTITATYQGKSCTAEVNVLLHTFDNAKLDSKEFYFDGSSHSLEVTGAPEGTQITYQNNGRSEAGEYTVTATLTKQYYETKTLTATLNIILSSYEIHYVLGLDGVANENPSSYKTDGENVKLKDPQLEDSRRSSYEFLGWYTDAEFQNKIIEIKGNARKHYTLYAKWQSAFTVSGGTITGLTNLGKQQTELVIDETINGTKITSIGEKAFYNNTKLQKITIPASVTSIGDWAFAYCSGLTSVTIGNSVTSIGSSAFEYCSGLKEVHISDLAAWCRIDFYGSSANPLYYAHHLYVGEAELKNLTIPSEIKAIKSYVFYNCSELTSVTIGSGVTSIGSSAFDGCSGLTGELKIPDSVTSIGDWAFYDCDGLTGELKIPDGVTSIGSSAFRDCSGLTSVTIGSGVTSIGDWAFAYCSGLTEIKVNANNPTYHSDGNCVIETKSKTLVVGCKTSKIPDDESVTSIGDGAFSGCSELTSINIPDSVISIGEDAFSGCTGLTSVTIGSGVISIGEDAFSGCTGLKNVTIESGSIGRYAFSGCSGLTSVTIGNGVTSIGNSAFYGCSGLTSVTIGSGVTSIGSSAFYKCSGLTSITIGSGVTSIGNSAFYGCSGLEQFIVDEDNTTYSSQDGVLYNKEKTKILEVPLAIKGPVTIPDSVTSIGSYAFRGCSGLTSIKIPNGVTSIGGGAFSGCSALTSVTIGSGVTSIGSYAFEYCSGLKEIRYNGTIDAWKGIQKGGAWDRSTGNYTIYCTNGTITHGGEETYFNTAQNVSEYVAVTPRKREF